MNGLFIDRSAAVYIFRSTQGRRDRGRPKSVAGANGPAVQALILNKRREKRAVGAYIL